MLADATLTAGAPASSCRCLLAAAAAAWEELLLAALASCCWLSSNAHSMNGSRTTCSPAVMSGPASSHNTARPVLLLPLLTAPPPLRVSPGLLLFMLAELPAVLYDALSAGWAVSAPPAAAVNGFSAGRRTSPTGPVLRSCCSLYHQLPCRTGTASVVLSTRSCIS